jgi:hypothetical protein
MGWVLDAYELEFVFSKKLAMARFGPNEALPVTGSNQFISGPIGYLQPSWLETTY